jgi:agmatine/peptidylarginine deiminase
MTNPNWNLPAEWEAQGGVLLAWPHAGTDWAPRLAEVERSYAALVGAIAAFQPAIVCVADAELREHAERLLVREGVRMDRVRFVKAEYDDTWLRDSGPITLVGEAGFRLLDFHFTGWGGKYGAERDDRLVAQLVESGLFRQSQHERIEFALEGGGIECDGERSLLTTWRCLHERHPALSREAIEHTLKHQLRQDRVLWLESGFLEGDDTDAHIDTLARFASPDSIVWQSCDDESDPHHFELSAMGRELAALRTRHGHPYRLFALPWARPILDEGRRLAASYANFLIINGAVLMPAYGDPADSQAAAVLAEAFPGRRIVPVPCRPLIWQNGSLHCVTMQLPVGLV